MIIFSSEKITEPGLWLQWDWGKGPVVPGPDGELRGTVLFCAWLAWSRFRVVLPVWDRTLPTLIACLDATLRIIGGVPVYALTDNEKTVTVDHVAGVPVRHPEIVAVGRHYGMTVHTCVPYDPRVQGRVGVDGEDRQGRPGAGGREPAGGLPEFRRAGGGVPGGVRDSERAGPPGDVRGPGGAAGHRAGPAAPAAGCAAYRARWAPPGW